MYNIDFLPQLERSRRYIFGNRNPEDPRGMPIVHYVPSKDVQLIQCEENEHGEWVPIIDSKLEKESQ
jgi:hypothetical protein